MTTQCHDNINDMNKIYMIIITQLSYYITNSSKVLRGERSGATIFLCKILLRISPKLYF